MRFSADKFKTIWIPLCRPAYGSCCHVRQRVFNVDYFLSLLMVEDQLLLKGKANSLVDVYELLQAF